MITKGEIVDVVVAEERLSPSFVAVATGRGYAPAREMIRRLYEQLGDRDGNFREQFQSGGFDARIWELCLFAYLQEAGFQVDRRHASPDFVVEKDRVALTIEATTANLSTEDDPTEFEPESQEQILYHITQRLPIKLGSPLFSKLNKRYWELPHIAGKPLLLAIESFAGGHSLWFADSSLASYLYGSRAIPWRLADGSLRVTNVPIEEHQHRLKKIPSGFFDSADTENISAVIFSNSGTIAKLNRMALQEGIEREGIARMFRVGFCYDHDPNAAVPLPFSYGLGEHEETWGEGTTVIHNPNALHPVDEAIFPNACHYFKDGEAIYAHVPSFHPFASRTAFTTAGKEQPLKVKLPQDS